MKRTWKSPKIFFRKITNTGFGEGDVQPSLLAPIIGRIRSLHCWARIFLVPRLTHSIECCVLENGEVRGRAWNGCQLGLGVRRKCVDILVSSPIYMHSV